MGPLCLWQCFISRPWVSSSGHYCIKDKWKMSHKLTLISCLPFLKLTLNFKTKVEQGRLGMWTGYAPTGLHELHD